MWTLRPVNFANLPGWASDDHLAAVDAFALQLLKPPGEVYRQGTMGVEPECLAKLAKQAAGDAAKRSPRLFFEENFLPYTVSSSNQGSGQVTGFYEPEVEAHLERVGPFQVPILRRPDNLVAINNNNRPADLDQSYRFGRQHADGSITAYFDRSQINAGAIEQWTDAIAFVQDPIDAFFIHIQGAARLRISDGTIIRITYDGKSGHPFTPIGRLLVQRGEIEANGISMQAIRSWLSANPDKATKLMEENRSYIFFKQSDNGCLSLGPIAAAKVPLSAGRSLAVDRMVHTFGTPIFVNAEKVNEHPFARLMIAQETGTAIVGPTRGDIFFGSGEKAGELAGAVNSTCGFTVLIPKTSTIDPERVRLP